MITITMSLHRRVTEVCVVMTLYGSCCVVMVLMGSFISNIAHYFDKTVSIRYFLKYTLITKLSDLIKGIIPLIEWQ